MRGVRLSIVIVSLAHVLTACGGGGDGTELCNANGSWSGDLAVSNNQCLLDIPVLSELHQIECDGDLVVLTTRDGRELHGAMTSDDSFDVAISDAQPFPIIDRVTYSNIKDGVASVVISHTFSRPGGCETRWAGEMTRND